ncbi:MAG TPA: hypothetical protein VJB34_00005 [Bdellovibrionota bacterium]|nr:hypothetical protein [Bdellovibrionota bacterium]
MVKNVLGLWFFFLSLTLHGCGQLSGLNGVAASVGDALEQIDFQKLSSEISQMINELRYQNNMSGITRDPAGFYSDSQFGSQPINMNSFYGTSMNESYMAKELVNQWATDPWLSHQMLNPQLQSFDVQFAYEPMTQSLYPYYYLGY